MIKPFHFKTPRFRCRCVCEIGENRNENYVNNYD